jgi:hypothetical protein
MFDWISEVCQINTYLWRCVDLLELFRIALHWCWLIQWIHSSREIQFEWWEVTIGEDDDVEVLNQSEDKIERILQMKQMIIYLNNSPSNTNLSLFLINIRYMTKTLLLVTLIVIISSVPTSQRAVAKIDEIDISLT